MKCFHMIMATILCLLCVESARADKPRLAIQEIVATDAVTSQARAQGQLNVLEQILQGADTQLANTMNQTSRFDIVARSKYKTILKEQEIVDSGDVNPTDPQAARAFLMAGAQYVATLTVDNYQDVTARANFEGGFGKSSAERRTIQIQATLQIFDTTSAVMLESATISIEDVATNEIMPGATEDGRITNALVGRVSKEMASKCSHLIMNALVPAKVIGYTMGSITFNRGDGAGVEVGQIWQVFFPGEEMFDPDTGESYGAEEVPLGWARVTSIQPKFSKAQAVEDFGISRGSIMRLAPNGLPANVDPNGRATGSSSRGQMNNSGLQSEYAGGSRRASSDNVTQGPGSTGNQSPGQSKRTKLALFIRDVSPDVPDEKVLVLETYITSWLTGQNITVINRAEVLNAVSDFAEAGSNEGSHDPLNTVAVQLLSDQTSAAALARNLGADGFIVATITSLVEDRREIRDPQRGDYTNIFYTLDVTWNIVDGVTGGSVVSGIAQAHQAIRQSSTLKRTFNIDTLLRENAKQVGEEAQLAMSKSSSLFAEKSDESMVTISLRIALSDLSIPEIRKDENGEYVISANRYQLEPLACNVIVDGMLAGTAPGQIQLTPGPHRIRIERPMIEPVDKFMVIRDGMSLVIPVSLTHEGLLRWKEQTAFFEHLKDKALIRDVELEKAKAFGEFLRNSKMNIDTSNVRSIGNGASDFWGKMLNMKDAGRLNGD